MFIPEQCTERERDGTWENCTECSGIMLYNAARAGNIAPSTEMETTILRSLSGRPQTGGSNLGDLQRAMKARYDWAPTRIGPPGAPRPAWTTVMAHLDRPGDAGVLQGGMNAWPASSHWNRWDPGFRGSHSVYVQRIDYEPRLWWKNPLAPASYPGEWIPLAEARRYFLAFVGGLAIARVGQLALPDSSTEEIVYAESWMPGPVTVPAGTTYYDSAAGNPVGSISSSTTPYMAVGTSEDGAWTCIKGRSSGRQRLGWVKTSTIKR